MHRCVISEGLVTSTTYHTVHVSIQELCLLGFEFIILSRLTPCPQDDTNLIEI